MHSFINPVSAPAGRSAQCVFDDDSGFGGLTHALLEHVRDEYPHRPVAAFGIADLRLPPPLLPTASRSGAPSTCGRGKRRGEREEGRDRDWAEAVK